MSEAVTPLAARLAGRIASDGPIDVAEYMAICLSDPEHGYYLHRDPLGRRGDFITSPEISQIFGELIGLWCVAVWEAMGSPDQFVLAELGPGRGTLLADALRAARVRPAFVEAASVALVEVSPRLRATQAETLADFAPVWVEAVSSVPPGPTIVLANEFFDALPIHQFVYTGAGWAERVIALNDGVLDFGLRPVAAMAPDVKTGAASIGAVIETRPAAESVAAELGRRLAAENGAALIIDYGYVGPTFGDTLQAVREHRYDDLTAHPGEADLTAHVDFTPIAAAAEKHGAAARPLVDQATFLQNLGIAERAERLVQDKDDAVKASIAAAVDRLTGPDQMGRLFKVLALSSPGLTLPAFDG